MWNLFWSENFILFKGLNILLPIIDNIRYVQSLKEIAIEIPSQTAISKGISKFAVSLLFKDDEKQSSNVWNEHQL